MSEYRPKIKETFYYPVLDSLEKYKEDEWYGTTKQEEMLKRGIICPIKEEAINLCNLFINSIKS